MEKLILRGVGWGAQKIPDAWFDKVPGGFYKTKEPPPDARKRRSGEQRRHHRSSSHRRRHSQDDDRHRRHRSDDDGGDDAGYRSDGHRSRHHDHRKSRVDGEDDYDPINNRLRRPRSRMMLRDEDGDYEEERYGHRDEDDGRYRRRDEDDERYRRRDEDDERHRHRDDYGRDSRYDSPRMNGRAPYPEQSAFPYRGPSDRPPMGPGPPLAAAGLGAAAAAAYANGSQSHSPTSYSPAMSSQTPSVAPGGVEGGYVPYANIYGQPVRSAAQQPPPSSVDGSVQPNAMNQVAPPVARQPYHQNPFAQQAAPGSQPGLGYTPDPYYNTRHYDDYDADRYDAYGRAPDRYPANYDGHRSQRADSRDSYDSQSDNERRRPRSRSRADDAARAKSQGRSKSRLREAFDTSQRGLGYSAVGALAGSLVGSEVGKGKVPAAVGAAVGAIGANAFGARERKKNDTRYETSQNDGTSARGEAKRSQRGATERGARDASV